MLQKYVLALFISVALAGCEGDVNTDPVTTYEAHNETGSLTLLMSLPKLPIKVRWELDEKKYQDNSSLVALLKYSEENYNHIIKNSSQFENRKNARLPIDFYKKWVPEELQDIIAVKQENGVYELDGIIPINPALFLGTGHSPYIHGGVIPLGEGYILVSLYTM